MIHRVEFAVSIKEIKFVFEAIFGGTVNQNNYFN